MTNSLSPSRIAIVVPTIRPESFAEFHAAWNPLFKKHDVELFSVFDGEHVEVRAENRNGPYLRTSPAEILGASLARKMIFNMNDGVRNIGFLAARKFAHDCQIILTLDDDVMPDGNDPIEEHLHALQMRVPISWFSTASEYMRGFPYGVRDEAEVWVSHGIWTGVHDYDGPTQLVNGNRPAEFYRGPIPKGCLTPVCGMNLAFRVEALPYIYFAPMGKKLGVQRFADIWMGINLKRKLDELGKAMVSGYSAVRHLRASNVLANLEQEAAGIRINEEFWKDANTGEGQFPKNYLNITATAHKEWRAICEKLK